MRRVQAAAADLEEALANLRDVAIADLEPLLLGTLDLIDAALERLTRRLRS